MQRWLDYIAEPTGDLANKAKNFVNKLSLDNQAEVGESITSWQEGKRPVAALAQKKRKSADEGLISLCWR